MSVPVIEVIDLSFSHPDGTRALDSVSLHIHEGESVALLGPNGAGKTSLVLHLNGIHEAQHGSVTVAGIPVGPDSVDSIRRRVGLVFQDPDDQLFMPTVRRDVAFGPYNLGLRGDALHRRVDEALAAVDITDLADRPPNHLSFGQRRRAAIAGVLAMEPDILVLDEPTSNLDPATRSELAQLLLVLGRTMLVVTHDLPFALQVCDRAIVLDAGAVVADGPLRDLVADVDLMRRHRLELPYGMTLDSWDGA